MLARLSGGLIRKKSTERARRAPLTAEIFEVSESLGAKTGGIL
jgi:hypothetical protein